MGSSTCVLLVLMLALSGILSGAGADDFDVGGRDGWVVPKAKKATIYNDWASKNRFQVGDKIRFKYEKDSVMMVTEEEYGKCRSAHPMLFSNSGETEVTLDHAGFFYFISGVAGHCERGQRMIIKVINHGDGPPPMPTPAPPPPSPPHRSAAAPAARWAGALAVAAVQLAFLMVV